MAIGGPLRRSPAADVEFQVEPSAVGGIRLRNTKQKDSAYLADLRLQLVPVGESCAVRRASVADKPETAEVPQPGTANTDDAVFFALLQLGAEGATFSQWHGASNKPKATFDRSRDRLVQAGRVKRDGDRYYCVLAPDDPQLDNGDEEDTPEDQRER